jgi:hypothetical protein
MKALYLVTAALFLATPSFSEAAAVRCKYLFREDDPVSRAVRSFQSGQTDTTSLRQEVKFVLKSSDVNKYMDVLQQRFSSRFKNRDVAPEGYANVTSTNYMKVGKYFQNGKKLSTKVRFRKYYQRRLDDTNWQHLRVIPELADRSWLELKIDHPDYDNVVFKPRLQVLDRDINSLVTSTGYQAARTGIARRLHELNPAKKADVDKFIAYFDALYSTPTMKVERMFAKTEYERTSYSIKLENPAKPGEFIDIQITLDQSVHLTRLKDGRAVDAYKPDETVVEVKIPLAYAGLTRRNIEAVPELAEVKKLIEYLTGRHLPEYEMNSGKMGKIPIDEMDRTDFDRE